MKLQVANKIQNESLNTCGDTFLKFNLDFVVTSFYLYPCCEFEEGVSETGLWGFLSPCGFFGKKKINNAGGAAFCLY